MLGAIWLVTAALAAPAQEAPGENRRALVLDIEKHVDELMADPTRRGLLRFETSVEVHGKSPQMMLERYFRELDLDCGPAGGPPTEAETRAARPHPSPYLDLSAAARALLDRVKSDAPPKYYVYRVVQGERVTYLLREGPLPASTVFNAKGVTFELVEGFADLKTGVTALKRLERGFATARSTTSAWSVPPWSTAPCRPAK